MIYQVHCNFVGGMVYPVGYLSHVTAAPQLVEYRVELLN